MGFQEWEGPLGSSSSAPRGGSWGALGGFLGAIGGAWGVSWEALGGFFGAYGSWLLFGGSLGAPWGLKGVEKRSFGNSGCQLETVLAPKELPGPTNMSKTSPRGTRKHNQEHL